MNKTDEPKGEYDVEDSIENATAMLGKGYEPVRAIDESKDRKYFTITPRIVKAFSRNSHDFAFWDTVKDVAGEAGECYLNTEQLAILSGISTGQVVNSRKYWLKIGFLKGDIRKDPGYSQAVWHLSVPDVWKQNVEWCEKYPKIAARLEFRKAHKALHRSLHPVKPSPSEGKGSRGETKKSIKEDLIFNNKEHPSDPNSDTPNIFEIYQSEIGVLTPFIADDITAYEKEVGSSWIIQAIHIAAEGNKRSWGYVKGVLKRAKEKGMSPDLVKVQMANDITQAKGKSNGQQSNNKEQYKVSDEQPSESDLSLAAEILRKRNAEVC